MNFEDLSRKYPRDKRDTIYHTHLEKIHMHGADLRGISERSHHYHFNGADLSHANMEGVRTLNLRLNNANLANANMEGAVIDRGYCNGTNFEGANMKNSFLGGRAGVTEFEDASMKNADLRGANLESVYLRRTDLRGANLQGAYAEGADFGGSLMDEHTKIEGMIIDGHIIGRGKRPETD